MTERLAGKIAIVTGAASGIGAATARTLSENGATVVVTDLNAAGGAVVAGELTNGEFQAQDVTDEAAWEALMAEVAARHGRIDILVNNAGLLPKLSPLEDTSLEEWRRVMAVNLDGVFLGVKHGIRAMKETGGAIINISSIMGLVGESIVGAYGASKGGVRILTKSAAIECTNLGYSIRINSVHPGYIDAGMFEAMADQVGPESLRNHFRQKTPMGRLGRAEEIAKGVLYLASDDASFMTGAELVIDGGFTAR